jgi:transcriptional antiterminator NusG
VVQVIDETANSTDPAQAPENFPAAPEAPLSAAPSESAAPAAVETATPEGSADSAGQVDDIDTPDAAYSDEREDVQPLEFIDETREEEIKTDWYILKVQVNREESISDALLRRVKVAGLEKYFADVIVPTESVREFNKSGKQRTVKKKLYPGYIMVNMALNDDTWFLVRETPGIGDFTGRAGKPTPMDPKDVKRILDATRVDETAGGPVKTTISFKQGDRVRVKEGYFQNFEGDVDAIDEANGRVTVMINIFGRSTPVELEHWQIEAL